MKYTNRHLYGQHFLSDLTIISRIIQIAEINNNTKVLEIGTGRGGLTKLIAQRAAYVQTVEIDRELFSRAKFVLDRFDNVEVVQKDILNMNDSGFDIIISSLPYNISTRFVEWLSGQGCLRAVIVLQTDFAEKLFQKPGTKKYNSVSVLSQFCFNVSREGLIPRTSFEPPPRVDSCIVKFERKVSLLDWRYVSKDLKYLFSFRGKMVRTVFKKLHLLYPALSIPSFVKETRRIEEMSPDDFMQILAYMRLGRNVSTQ
ncbi:MAG: 16S rRNA (adenine(1518)-N(6)/adenine(1519)-N(6))-dimethyltransferase RsmA [Conexivisphaerales archaeon]